MASGAYKAIIGGPYCLYTDRCEEVMNRKGASNGLIFRTGREFNRRIKKLLADTLRIWFLYTPSNTCRFCLLSAETKIQLYRNVIYFGLITGALTIAWIGFEYLIGTFFGIPRLGPLYGLVSMIFFIIMTTLFLKQTDETNPDQMYFDRIGYHFMMTSVASTHVV